MLSLAVGSKSARCVARQQQAMAPAVAFAPKHACYNFPICTAAAYESRNGAKRIRSLFCSSCSSSMGTCAFDDCDRKPAPLVVSGCPISLCAFHYRDPSAGSIRVWKLCSNARLGCTQLAEKRKGVKCFACGSHSLPCLHASAGCPRHIPSSHEPAITRIRNLQ